MKRSESTGFEILVEMIEEKCRNLKNSKQIETNLHKDKVGVEL